MAELTSTGLSVRSQDEIQAEIEADQIGDISASLDLSTSSPWGQLNRIQARALALLEEALAGLYAGLDFDSATGDLLFRLGVLRGTIREAATASRCSVTVSLNAGTYAPGTLVVAPSGRPADTFRNVDSVTVAVSPTSVAVVFAADATGPTAVAANTFVIASPLSGFLSVVSHPAATPGQAIESEAAFRRRSNAEITAIGSASVSGIAADISQNVPGVISVFGVENDGDVPVDSIPPHGIEMIVFGPSPAAASDDDAVASQILASAAGGIQTYGTTTRTVYDSEGYPHAISFTRPANVPATVQITVVVDPLTFPGAAAVQNAIAAQALASLAPGVDVAWSRVASWALGVTGVYRVSSIGLNGGGAVDVAITTRQRGTIDAADVTVTVVNGSP